MDDLAICSNLMCGVYVFGHSAERCPGCQNEGTKLNERQAIAFTRVYREVQNS